MNTSFLSRSTARAVFALLCLSLAFLTTVFSPDARGQFSVIPSQPWFIHNHPPSFITSATGGAKFSIIFGAYADDTDIPSVDWYLNGAYLTTVSSVVTQKVVDTASGTVSYTYWDPFLNKNALGGPASVLPGRARVAWTNTIVATVDKPGIYTAYIPRLNAWTNSCQVVFAPSVSSGAKRDSLEIVKSPSDVYRSTGGSMRIWGDAKSHVNALIHSPFGTAVDSEGFVYIADTLNHAIRKVSPGGHLETMMGIDGQQAWISDWSPTASSLSGGIINVGTFVTTGSYTGTLTLDDATSLYSGYILSPSAWTGNITYGGRSYLNGSTTSGGGSLGSLTVISDYSLDGATVAVTSGTAWSSAGVTSATGVSFFAKDSLPARRMVVERAPVSGAPTALESGSGVASRQSYKDSRSYRPRDMVTTAQYNALTANEPLLKFPEAVAAANDQPASVYVADTGNNAIRRLETIEVGTMSALPTGKLTPGDVLVRNLSITAGTQYSNRFNADGVSNGLVSGSVSLVQPRGLAFKRSINDPTKMPVLYVLDNFSIKRLELNPFISTVDNLANGGSLAAGTVVRKVTYIGSVVQSQGWRGDSSSDTARLYTPRGIVVESDSYDGVAPVLYVADTVNHVIRRMTLPLLNVGTCQTVKGSKVLTVPAPLPLLNGTLAGTVYLSGDNIPDGLTVESVSGGTIMMSGAAIASGTSSVSITQITLSGGSVSVDGGTIFVSGTAGLKPGMTLTGANFLDGTIIKTVRAGAIEIQGGSMSVSPGAYLPSVGSVVKDITKAGPADWRSDIVAGVIGANGTDDGATGFYANRLTQATRTSRLNSVARLSYPSGICSDGYGNLYFTEMGTHRIRRLTIDRINSDVSARVDTIAGSGSPGPFDGSWGEGVGEAASFWYPAGIALDTTSSDGTTSLLVADSANHAIRKVSLSSNTVSLTGAAFTLGSSQVTVATTASLSEGMSLTGADALPPGATVSSIDSSTTFSMTGVASATSTGETLTASAALGSSSNYIGFVGLPGNRDFSVELPEYYYTWLKWGVPIAGLSRSPVPVGYDTRMLRLSNMTVEDSGPYELSIRNYFGLTGETDASNVYVAPNAIVLQGGTVNTVTLSGLVTAVKDALTITVTSPLTLPANAVNMYLPAGSLFAPGTQVQAGVGGIYTLSKPALSSGTLSTVTLTSTEVDANGQPLSSYDAAPKFAEPGYVARTPKDAALIKLAWVAGTDGRYTGLVNGVSSADLGFVLRSYIIPADQVNYQWQVSAQSDTGVDDWLNLVDSPGTQLAGVTSLMGKSGTSSGKTYLNISGALTSELKVTGLQRSLAEAGVALPQLRFRVIATAKNPLVTANGSVLSKSYTVSSTLVADSSGTPLGAVVDTTPEPVSASISYGVVLSGGTVDSPIAATLSGTLTSGTSNILVASTAGLSLKMAVSGVGIPANATITNLISGGTVVISAPATLTTSTLLAAVNATPNPSRLISVGSGATTMLDFVVGQNSVKAFPRLTSVQAGSLATLQGGTSLLAKRTLAYSDSLNPTAGVMYAWMYKSSDTASAMQVSGTLNASGVLCGTPLPLSPGTLAGGTYSFIPFPATGDGSYFVRLWTGPEGEAYTSKNVIGKYVDTDPITIATVKTPAITSVRPTSVFVSQSLSSGNSFSLSADVVGATGVPKYYWYYSPWSAADTDVAIDPVTKRPTGTDWELIVSDGTLVTSGTWGARFASGGTQSVIETKNRATLQFSSILTPTVANPTVADVYSGRYLVQAVVPGNGMGGPAYACATSLATPTKANPVRVALRYVPVFLSSQGVTFTATTPSVTAADLLDANNYQNPYAVNLNNTVSVSMAAKFQIPPPDIQRYTDKTVDYVKQELSYTWLQNGFEVSLGSSRSGNEFKLTIPKVGSGDLGTYTLTVKNNEGSSNGGPLATGSTAYGWQLISDGSPFLLLSPSARTAAGPALLGGSSGSVQRVAVGQSVTLEVGVQSSTALKYTWRKTSLPARPDLQTSSGRYLIRTASLLDSGTYKVLVRPSTSLLESESLKVNGQEPTLILSVEALPEAPVITPATQTVLPGGTISLTGISAITGTLFSANENNKYFTYQWKKDGVAIPGETGQKLTITRASRSHAGAYSFEVTSAAGTKATLTSAAVTVSSSTTADTLYKVNLINSDNIRKTILPTITASSTSISGSLAAGTKMSLTGVSSASDTFLGWRIWDEAGRLTDLSPSGAQYLMPASNVTIYANSGRNLQGNYSGLICQDIPWNKYSSEWGYPNESTPVAGRVRGYVTSSLTALGALSGKVTLEGKTYSFAGSLAWLADGTFGSKFSFKQVLADGTPWLVAGKVSMNTGFKVQVTPPPGGVLTGNLLTGGSYVFSSGTSDIILSGTSPIGKSVLDAVAKSGSIIDDALVIKRGMSVAGGLITNLATRETVVPETTTVVSVGTISSGTSTNVVISLSQPFYSMPAEATLLIGANTANDDNSLHFTFSDVVLEKTAPVLSAGQTLYCSAVGSRGAMKALNDFILTDSPDLDPTLLSLPNIPRYTGALSRYMSGDTAAGSFGRAGVLSVALFMDGTASVLGYLPNGSKLTFTGPVGRAIYPDPADPADVQDLLWPVLRVDTGGLTADAYNVMQEALKHSSGSVVLPVWPLVPSGDTRGQPVYGALLFSGMRMDGCLGSLNPMDATKTDSEYTYNLAEGWFYDNTTAGSGISRPAPFTNPAATGQTLPLSIISPTGDVTSLATLAGAATAFGPPVSTSATVDSKIFSFTTAGASFNSGLLTGYLLESTSDYVTVNSINSGLSSGATWASNGTSYKSLLNCGLYGVLIQGGVSTLVDDYGKPVSKSPVTILNADGSVKTDGGAVRGFLVRGTSSPDKLQSVIGNVRQTGFTKGTKTTFRNEALKLGIENGY